MFKSIMITLAGAALCVLLTACGQPEAPQGDAAVVKAAEVEQAAKDKAHPEQSMTAVSNDDVMKGYKPQAVQPGVSQPAKAATSAKVSH
jgi:hypothetical protein